MVKPYTPTNSYFKLLRWWYLGKQLGKSHRSRIIFNYFSPFSIWFIRNGALLVCCFIKFLAANSCTFAANMWLVVKFTCQQIPNVTIVVMINCFWLENDVTVSVTDSFLPCLIINKKSGTDYWVLFFVIRILQWRLCHFLITNLQYVFFSACGLISSVALRQPNSSGGTLNI